MAKKHPTAAEVHQDDLDELARLAEEIIATTRTIADLRDRLQLLRSEICARCGCAAKYDGWLCDDCWRLERAFPDWGDELHTAAACVSVGLRALCGRRILEGC